MKSKSFALAALLAAAFTTAHASGIGNTYNQPTAKGGESTATAGAIGVGVGIAGAASNSSSGGNTQTTTVQGDAASRMPASTAYAAGLAASNGTCLGSASGGVQGMGAGISFGSTKLDEGCDTRYDVQTLQALGMPAAAIARACQKPEMAAAMEAAGRPCKPLKAATPVAGYTGNDPYVLQRLGN